MPVAYWAVGTLAPATIAPTCLTLSNFVGLASAASGVASPARLLVSWSFAPRSAQFALLHKGSGRDAYNGGTRSFVASYLYLCRRLHRHCPPSNASSLYPLYSLSSASCYPITTIFLYTSPGAILAITLSGIHSNALDTYLTVPSTQRLLPKPWIPTTSLVSFHQTPHKKV